MSAREHISGTAGPISRNLLRRSPVVLTRSSSGSVAILYVLPVLWMTSRLAVWRCVASSVAIPGRSLMSTNALFVFAIGWWRHYIFDCLAVRACTFISPEWTEIFQRSWSQLIASKYRWNQWRWFDERNVNVAAPGPAKGSQPNLWISENISHSRTTNWSSFEGHGYQGSRSQKVFSKMRFHNIMHYLLVRDINQDSVLETIPRQVTHKNINNDSVENEYGLWQMLPNTRRHINTNMSSHKT